MEKYTTRNPFDPDVGSHRYRGLSLDCIESIPDVVGTNSRGTSDCLCRGKPYHKIPHLFLASQRFHNKTYCDIEMKQGTVSVLVGCHSPIHSVLVFIAWIKLYRSLPRPWELVCILIHDIGHWGKSYLDSYEEKQRHAELGAQVARVLFGQKGYDLVMGHNACNGQSRSKLFEPDKYSWVIAPGWWMVTNAWFEPKLIRKGSTRRQSAVMFKEAMRENMANGWDKRGHDIYLEQWGHGND